MTDLLAKGTPVKLANGETRTLRLRMRELHAIETKYGTYPKFAAEFAERPISTLVAAFAICFNLTEDEAEELMEVEELQAYSEAMAAEIERAVPQGEARAPETAQRTDRSPGNGSTTSESSASTSASATSGT